MAGSSASAEIIPLAPAVRPGFKRAIGIVAALFFLLGLVGTALDATAPLVIGLTMGAGTGLLWLLLLLTTLSNANAAGALTVGDDGLLVQRGAKRSFYPYSEIHSAMSTPISPATGNRSQLLLVLKKGGDLPLFWSAPGKLAEFLDRVARIEAARLACVNRAQVTGIDELARGARTVATWRADLAGTATTFRTSERPPEALAEVLASPNAPAEQRVGAALALRVAAEDPEARLRIRVAAEASADPVLRAALQAVAEDDVDDRRLEAALVGAPSR